MSEYSGKQSLLLLGNFDAKHVHFGTDSETPDKFSQLALKVPAPGKSLSTVEASATGQELPVTVGAPVKRVQLKNCQTWMKGYVDLLVREGVLGQEAIGVLDGAPRN